MGAGSFIRGVVAVAVVAGTATVPAGSTAQPASLRTGPARVPPIRQEPPEAGAPGPCDRSFGGFQLPVGARVVDPFRAPVTRWGPGNRGWEFATLGGEAVCAVGRGTITFAGPVAGRIAVTIRHPDGMLSSVTGLSGVTVAAGTVVRSGDRLGSAGARLHLGFRVQGRYVDPASVFSMPTHAILVPLPPD